MVIFDNWDLNSLNIWHQYPSKLFMAKILPFRLIFVWLLIKCNSKSALEQFDHLLNNSDYQAISSKKTFHFSCEHLNIKMQMHIQMKEGNEERLWYSKMSW